MTDIFSKKKRSYIMSRVKSENTSIEILAKKLMRENNIAGFGSGKGVFGKPDFVFKDKKIAIFIDGSFWHGRGFNKLKNKLPKFWSEKIYRNIKRDRKVNSKLKKEGWKILRIWDYKLKKCPEKYIKKITELVG